MPGFVPDVGGYMAYSALFVLSSRWEGFGNVLVEAMSHGTPVVATDCRSGPREILADGRFGRLVPVGDDTALAAAMIATLDDPPAPETLREAAAAYGIERSTARYMAILGLGKPSESTSCG